MLNTRYIIESALAVDGGDDLAAEARKRHKETYPGRTARRMTHLGILTGLCINQLDIRQTTPVIYASGYAESESLEAFIDSFPDASPLHFQRSIHPSAVEQSFIANKQAINTFYPITSDFNLAGQALENALIHDAEQVAVVGGEERGTWLCQHDLASNQSFACSLLIKQNGPGIGILELEDDLPNGTEADVDLNQLFLSIKNRTSIRIPSFLIGRWIRITWA